MAARKKEPEADPDPAEVTAARAAFAARCGLNADSPRLRLALTHVSAAGSVAESSERLEFLGDAVLSLIVARHLMDALPETTDEGTLSRSRTEVVRTATLAEAARALGVSDLLEVGTGERKQKRHRHDSLLEDAYEAILGAVFLDCGHEAAERFVRETLAGPLSGVVASPPPRDPKTALQETLQGQGRGLPQYRVVEQSGEGHGRHFVVEAVTAQDETLGRGEGKSKRTAEIAAAEAALVSLNSS